MVILNLPLSTMIINTWCHPLIDTWSLSLDASLWKSPNPQKHRQHIVWVSTQSAIDNFSSYHKILCGALFALVCWPFRVWFFDLYLGQPLSLLHAWSWCLKGHIEFFTMLHFFKTWLPISQSSYDHMEFIHEYHISHHLFFFMLHHNILRGITNSSLELLASRPNHTWLNIWAHHDPIFKPYVEFFSLIILSRSWSIMAQPISLSMTTFEILQWTPYRSHLVRHMDFILIIFDSIIELNLDAQLYVDGIHSESIQSPSCITHGTYLPI